MVPHWPVSPYFGLGFGISVLRGEFGYNYTGAYTNNVRYRTVLDGELAVPCYPQSAIVELNSPPRLDFVWTVSEKVVMRVWALRKVLSVNPVRTGR